ncbi:MAG: FAD-dependent oxidoreductase [bacterium]|nr:FAD-dependent oxidoreductase [bacterium]
MSDGTEIMADRVLSNATVWNLYGKLIRKRHIKPKRLEWAQSLVPTFPSLVLYLAIDAAAVPEGTTPIQMMIENMYDISGNDITVYVSSLDDPSLCPPGIHTMTAMAPVPDSIGKWPRPWEPAYHSEEYQRLKEQEAEKLLCQVEKHFTDLRKHIKFMEIGTPATIEHFTLKNWGAVGGPKQAIGQEMMKRLKAQSEWENLYNCGDSTVMGVGILATTVSGVTAANRILMDMGLEAYVPRSFDRQYINLVKGKPWTPPPDISEPITPESALRISRECQHCRAPECMKSCPAGIDVLNFLRRIETGNFPGAVRSMREMNPMAEICGHICPAEKLCQKNCNRLDFSDQATRIADLQAWVCSQVSNVEGWNRYHPPANGYRVAVIGAGPAGLSCAHFLARLGYRIDIMDKSNKMGGLPVHAIPVSRLPEEVAHREIEGMLLAGINFEHGKTLGKDFTLADLEKSYDAVFMAPGLWTGRKLNLPGLKSAHAIDALSFLKSCRSKKKVKVGKNVLVIGGGSVAADAAITAEYHGAARVSMICLEKIEEMPCLEDEIMTLNKKGIQLKNGWGPKEVLSNSKITFIGCTSVFDKKGNFNPVYDDSKIMEIDFDQIIMAVGQSAEPALAKYLKKEFNTDGLIEIEEKTMQIKGRPGIYAGGDIVNGAGTVVQAVGDGRRAALAIDEKVNIKTGF